MEDCDKSVKKKIPSFSKSNTFKFTYHNFVPLHLHVHVYESKRIEKLKECFNNYNIHCCREVYLDQIFDHVTFGNVWNVGSK